MLGGVRIPSDFGLRGHSDADVLLHALTDALLGALALGDIGQWFPDTDLTHAGADSGMLLRKVLTDPRTRPWSVVNADTTVLAERPRLAPHTENIRISLAQLLDCPCECVSVKAKTMEGTGVIGEGGAIAAHAVVLVSQE